MKNIIKLINSLRQDKKTTLFNWSTIINGKNSTNVTIMMNNNFNKKLKPNFGLIFILLIVIFFYKFICILFLCSDISWDFMLLNSLIPIKIYDNAGADKSRILKENKELSGVYCFTNLINGNQYIGSSGSLKRRFDEYFRISSLEKSKCMPICCALLKHGYSNFSLEILEYCEVSELLIREKHYIKLLAPTYNIIQDPTTPPMTGCTHSTKTRKIMSDVKKGENNPMFGCTGENNPMFGKKHSLETIAKISNSVSTSMTGRKHSPETLQKMSTAQNPGHFQKGKAKTEGSGRPSQQIEVFDNKTNQTINFESISEAARVLNISSHKTISNYIRNNQVKPYKDRFIFRLVG